jgi:hypothetical protein
VGQQRLVLVLIWQQVVQDMGFVCASVLYYVAAA